MVKSDEDRTIIGFVNKVELRYALGEHFDSITFQEGGVTLLKRAVDKAMRTRHLSPNATCTFQALGTNLQMPNGSGTLQPDIVIPGRNPSRSPNLDQSRPSASEAHEVDFGQYVDEVSPTHKAERVGLFAD